MALRPAHFERLLKLLRRKGRSREDAEDLIQEAMLRLHVYARNVAISNEEAFLRRAVHNLSIDQYRRDRPDLHRKVPIDTVHFDAEWMYVNSNLEQIVDTYQRLDKVGALLEAASTRTREVYVAHRAGYTYAEITDNMNISAITVKRHIARALRIVMEYQAKKRGEGHGDLGIDGPHVRVGIAAPKTVIVDREEIYVRKRERKRSERLVPESF
jgi:RNA polymerase sigma factor (sigma-70 family)